MQVIVGYTLDDRAKEALQVKNLLDMNLGEFFAVVVIA